MRIRWLGGVTGLIATLFAYMVGAGGNPATVGSSGAPWYEIGPLLTWLGLPSLMGIGAIAAGRSPRVGRVLMSSGAVFASVFLVPYGVAMMFSRLILDISALSILSLSVATVVLVICSDVALVSEARSKRAVQR